MTENPKPSETAIPSPESSPEPGTRSGDPEGSRPGVSVIIPCHNEAEYVGGAIQSVVDQSHSPIEIIIVDDGSTDGTGEVVRQYGERTTYLRQDHGGVCRARNWGIRVAQYPFLVFLDADDRMTPDAAEVMVDKMEAYGETCALVSAEILLTDEETIGELKRGADQADTRISFEDLILKNRIAGNPMVRKCAIEEIDGFDESLTHSEDRDAWIRLAARWEVVKIGRILTIVVNRPRSASKNAPRMKAGMLSVLKKSRNLEFAKDLPPAKWRTARSMLHYQCSIMFADQGSRVEAVRELALSFLWHPRSLRNLVPRSPVLLRTRKLLSILRSGSGRSKAGLPE